MVVKYTTADNVARLLQTTPFDTTSTPTTTQVETIINRKEDRIDQKLMHSWRVAASKELFLDPAFIDYRNGLRYNLPNYSIKTLSSVDGDVLEVWDGTKYVDYLTEKTEGRDEDFWLDYNLGVLYIRNGSRASTKKSIKIKFRYGEDTVTGDIEDLCTLMTCVDVLIMYPRAIRFPDDGGSMSLNNQQKIDNFNRQIKEIYNSLANISTI